MMSLALPSFQGWGKVISDRKIMCLAALQRLGQFRRRCQGEGLEFLVVAEWA